jgi:hypothetical protein
VLSADRSDGQWHPRALSRWSTSISTAERSVASVFGDRLRAKSEIRQLGRSSSTVPMTSARLVAFALKQAIS